MEKAYSLCWTHQSTWGNTGTYEECYPFDSVDAIIKIMKSCYYRGEWIEDVNGNKIDIDLSKYALKERN
ncbi:hypothetical protein SMD22_01450 (plasmid) [Brevibacillus halotolerans]|nr:hypothetical protein SMD22_01450 [Brevibacillus halotolerans]